MIFDRKFPPLKVELPDWVTERVEQRDDCATMDERVQLAIELAHENVTRGTGGPFGAAIFESESGRIVAAGVNLVVPSNNCVLHAEVVAFMFAQARVGSYSLAGAGMPAHEMATSCEPCAMCLGATLWSGVKRLVYAATREDAASVNFDEGPVFPESYAYLLERGVEVVGGVRRAEGRAVLELYGRTGGVIYNG